MERSKLPHDIPRLINKWVRIHAAGDVYNGVLLAIEGDWVRFRWVYTFKPKNEYVSRTYEAVAWLHISSIKVIAVNPDDLETPGEPIKRS
jgi:hypothetical protein